MQVKFYERRGLCYAQVLKDNGGVLAEGSGGTPEEALTRLQGVVDYQVETWTKTQSLLGCFNEGSVPG